MATKRKRAPTRRTIPKRIFVVLDTDPTQTEIADVYRVKSDATNQRDWLNRLPMYEPTCEVVEYVRVTPRRGRTRR